MLATDLMRHVGDLSDVTSEQVKQSRAEYRKASDQLAPFKRILDVYTSQWFGNTPYKHKVGKSTTVLKPAISFLKDRESEQWIKKPHDLDSLSSHGREIASIALAASEEKRFFHWELEFPEVFYGPRPGTTQAIERLPDAGFDAVIGNPPYVRQEGLGEDKPFFEYAHAPVYSGVADLYVYFYHRGLSILRPGGRFGMITSNKFLRAKYGKALRTFLKQNKIVDLIDFRDLPIFEDAIAYPLILIAERNQPAEDHALQTHSVADMDQANRIAEVMDTAPSMSLTSLSEDGWTLKSPEVLVILEKIRKAGKPLGEVVEKKFYYGIKTGFNEAFIVDETKREELIAADPKSAEIIKPFLRGKDVKRWKVEWSGLYLIKTEMGVNIKQYPAILDHLKVYREALEARWDKGDHWWELRTCAYYLEFEKPKIVYPDIYEHQSFAYDTSGALLINTLYFIPTKERWMVGLLNSNLMEFFYREITAQVRGGYMRSFSVYIQQLPIVDPPASAKKNLDSLIESIISNPDDDGAIHNHEMAIDEIVYGLYGLTGEEIRLVEGTSA
jgi:hypothetical protein